MFGWFKRRKEDKKREQVQLASAPLKRQDNTAMDMLTSPNYAIMPGNLYHNIFFGTSSNPSSGVTVGASYYDYGPPPAPSCDPAPSAPDPTPPIDTSCAPSPSIDSSPSYDAGTSSYDSGSSGGGGFDSGSGGSF